MASFAAALARFLLVAALLAAQHSALAHGIRHPGDEAPAQKTGTRGDPLCDQHSALGTVLGAIDGAETPAPVAPARAVAIAIAPHACASAAPLAPSSRDPPALS